VIGDHIVVTLPVPGGASCRYDDGQWCDFALHNGQRCRIFPGEKLYQGKVIPGYKCDKCHANMMQTAAITHKAGE